MQLTTKRANAKGARATLRACVSRIGSNGRKIATAGGALLALGVGYHVVFGANGLTVYQGKRLENRALDAEVKQLQQENDLLKGHVGRLQSDPGAIEHEAREQLHYARPGEVIYQLDNRRAGGSGSVSQGSGN